MPCQMGQETAGPAWEVPRKEAEAAMVGVLPERWRCTGPGSLPTFVSAVGLEGQNSGETQAGRGALNTPLFRVSSRPRSDVRTTGT